MPPAAGGRVTAAARRTIGILVVDDHPVTREGLALILDNQPDMRVVGQAQSGEAAVEEFRRLRPDVTIMDLQMRGMSGVRAIERILEESPGAGILVLTTFDGDEDIHRAMHAGARAYLLKDAPREELLRGIRAVHAGHRYLSPAAGARLAERVMQTPLTEREAAVLRLVAEGHSNKEIGARLGIAEGTVKSHVNSVIMKLGVASRVEAALAAHQRGLLRD